MPPPGFFGDHNATIFPAQEDGVARTFTFELASEANDCQFNFPDFRLYVMIYSNYLLPSTQASSSLTHRHNN